MFCHRAKWHTCSADTFIWAAPYTQKIYSSNHLLSKDKVVLLLVVVFCSMTDWASKCLFQTKFLPELDWVNRTQPGLLWSETTWYATAFNQNGVSWLPRVGQMFLLNSYLYLLFLLFQKIIDTHVVAITCLVTYRFFGSRKNTWKKKSSCENWNSILRLASEN